ncbi:MAG: hypothetical protein QOG86_1497, partial [Thermoleophilaceae bacterium]|nr:hypothetical protein [Thermoleophilaceae bacterium]
PARGHLGIEPALPGRNGAQRQRDALEGGAAIAEVFATEVETTRSTYAGQEVTT